MRDYTVVGIYKEDGAICLNFGDWGAPVFFSDASYYNEYLINRLQAGDVLAMEGPNGDTPEELCIFPGGVSEIFFRPSERASIKIYASKDSHNI